MKRKLTKMVALVAVCLLSAWSVNGQSYLEVTEEISYELTKTSIEANEFISWSHMDKWGTNKTYCDIKGDFPNMSDGRTLDFKVKGVEKFVIFVYSTNSDDRTYSVSIDGVKIDDVIHMGNKCESKEYNTNKLGEITITITGTGKSLYPSEVVFYPSSCTEAEFSFPQEEIEVNESAEEITPLVLTNTQNIANVTYSSSNTDVVTVDISTGALTKVGGGEAIITAEAPRQEIEGVTYCSAVALYVVKVLSNSAVLESTTTELDLKLGKFETTKSLDFTISGYNLSGEASVVVPDGFTLEPSTFTINNRTVDQEYKLTYSATEPVAESVAELVFAVGESTVAIQVAYGKEAQTEWTPVTGASTWNFAGQIGNETTLNADGLPAQNQMMVLADFPGLTPKDDFNATALKVRGQRMSTTYWQGDSLLFNVDKAGTIEVSFSNTGNRTAEVDRRFLMVQDKVIGQGEPEKGTMSSKEEDMVTVSNIPVTAGEVVIYGVMGKEDNSNIPWVTPQYLRYYKIVYTSEGVGPSTICNNPTIDGVWFDGRTIMNSEKQMLEVYDVAGRMVMSSNENVDMANYKGVFVVKAQQGTMKIAVTK